MKKIICGILSVVLIITLFTVPASAQTDYAAVAERVVRAAGIMVGDENDNLNLDGDVTRAQFAKLMVAASEFKDSAGAGSGFSLFGDVKSTHWAAEYIKIAVDNGWFTGYADGTFKPDGIIKLEEAATALLRLLGYTSGDLSGTYPTAQLTKFNALGLNANVTKTRGETLTRYDCMIIIYNLLTATAKNGSRYAQTLGITLDSAGAVDYNALVASGTKGPFVLTSGSLGGELPFSGQNISVYKNGKTSSLSAASAYDVYYYHSGLRTVWLYSNKVTGTLSAVAPNAASPSSVTVSSTQYALETSAAAYKVSSRGEFAVNDTVTLLLGMNGDVADIVGASSVSMTYYGMIIAASTRNYTDGDGRTVTADTVTIACTDGVERQYDVTAAPVVGTLVSVSHSGGLSVVASLYVRSLNGTVNRAGTTVGDLTFAEDAGIMDVVSKTEYVRISAERLASITLSNSDVKYYVLDEEGRISGMILNNVTGDGYEYALVTSATETASEDRRTLSGSYTYISGGVTKNLNVSENYGVQNGGVMFLYENGSLSRIRNLKQVALRSINDSSAEGADRKYMLAGDVQIYARGSDGTYRLVSAATVMDTEKYILTGYYDDFGLTAGGRLRVIVAREI